MTKTQATTKTSAITSKPVALKLGADNVWRQGKQVWTDAQVIAHAVTLHDAMGVIHAQAFDTRCELGHIFMQKKLQFQVENNTKSDKLFGQWWSQSDWAHIDRRQRYDYVTCATHKAQIKRAFTSEKLNDLSMSSIRVLLQKKSKKTTAQAPKADTPKSADTPKASAKADAPKADAPTKITEATLAKQVTKQLADSKLSLDLFIEQLQVLAQA
jgi:hypothetical protein